MNLIDRDHPLRTEVVQRGAVHRIETVAKSNGTSFSTVRMVGSDRGTAHFADQQTDTDETAARLTHERMVADAANPVIDE